MNWNIDESKELYLIRVEYLKNMLGLPVIDVDLVHPELLPYYAQILDYINTDLLRLGSGDRDTIIEEIGRLYSMGSELIIADATIELVKELKIPNSSAEYIHDRFVFSWTQFMTNLLLRLKFTYPGEDKYNCDCPCPCTKGETHKDYESWVSGVYPEDGEYDRTNYDRISGNWQYQKEDHKCGCYRHISEE